MAEKLIKQKKLGIIGAGHMGSALIRGIVAAKIMDAQNITACDLAQPKLDALRGLGIKTTNSIEQLAADADIIILAVKPQGFDAMLKICAPIIDSARQLVISIAAGIHTEKLESVLQKNMHVVRAMPNLAMQVLKGATVISRGSLANDADMALARLLFGTSGIVHELPEESLDAVTGLSGSGPAYLFFLAECLMEAGVQEGLSPDVARELTAHTFMGAGEFLVKSDDTPSKLLNDVTSPNGTTEAAFRHLNNNNVGEIIITAVRHAVLRSRELGQDY